MNKKRFSLLWLIGTCALLCAVFFAVSAMAAPNPNRAFAQARTGVLELAKDAKRSQLRDQWLRYADTFDELYEKNPKWGNRPSALFRAAAAYDALARRSHTPADAEKALQRYEKLTADHPQNSLADDALFEAAKLANENLRDGARAKGYLDRITKEYPKGDMIGAARAYTSKVTTESPPREAPARSTPERERVADFGKVESDSNKSQTRSNSGATRITQVQWQSKRNLVRITIDLERPVNWVVYSQRPDAKSGRPARLVVDMANATPESRIKSGARIDKSLLTRLRVDLSTTGNTRLLLDFSDLKRFSVKTEQSPYRLVISASDTDSALPNGQKLGGKAEESGNATGSSSTAGTPSRIRTDMATQLGLGVRTIILDAGHGGNDPGTEHNGIVERVITLQVAKKLSDELRRMGFTTRLTRSSDQRIDLTDRATIANEAKGDLLVSIHINASTLPETQGFETYFLDFASSSAAARVAAVENAMADKTLGDMERLMADLMLGARTQESRRLATAIQSGTVQYMRKKKLAIRDGGLRAAPFHVLLGSGMPGVLVELGYCTNKTEAARLKDNDYLSGLARGIAEGIRNYSTKLNR